ncbi:MAG: PAS domain S-box protein [Bacteroidetes bacterium]|nr:PAS domain S-box protein [Bacteroidota bacterium]
MNNIKSSGEEIRLQRLQEYQILDTVNEKPFDDLTSLASYICECPVAMINMIDSNRQWTKSAVGFEVYEVPRNQAICAYTVQSGEVLLVEDLSKDPRFMENPYVKNIPGARFYCGVPICSYDGLALGSLCVLDTKPRSLTDPQMHSLKILALQVRDQMELRRSLRELQKVIDHDRAAQNQLDSSAERFERILDTSKDGILVERDEKVIYMNHTYAELFGRSSREEMMGLHLSELAAPEDLERLLEFGRKRSRGEPAPTHYEFRIKHKEGQLIDLEASVSDFNQEGHHYIITFARDIRERKRIQAEREQMIVELKDALSKVKTLQGLLPICASCKKVRDDKGYWSRIEEYIESRTDADFTHGICPDCAHRLYPEAFDDD